MGKNNVEQFYPLSPMQHGMLFHSLYAPEGGLYIGQLSCVLRGQLDLAAFEQAWQRVVERHTILRTTFVSGDLKEPIQVVNRQVRVPLVQHDWRDRSADEQHAQLEAFLHEDQRRGFKLTAPPLMRLALMRLSDDQHQLVWTYHHILFDGWSLPLILREVFTLYQALVGRSADASLDERALGLTPAQPFRNYIAWLRKQTLAEAERFWRGNLAGFSAPTPLVVDRSVAQPDADAPYSEVGIFLSEATTGALQSLGRSRNLTLNTVVQGAWALLLSRYSGAEDVLFGATVSGRPTDLPGAEQMIGLFINTLPVRVRVPSTARVLDWLQQLQAQQLDIRQYEWSPLVQIHGWSEIPRSLPLFESLLVFENTPVGAALEQREQALNISALRSVQKTNYPLTVIAEPGQQLNLRIAYDGGRFDDATIDRMLGHLETILTSFVAAPQQPLADVPLLSEAERAAIHDWNATAQPFPLDRCVHELFAEQAARTPDAVAVRFEDAALSYAELNQRANQVAHHLRARGVGPDVLVGLCLEPSLDLVVGVLGVLKAGGAYVPLEPTYPAERLQFMIADAQVSLLLTQQRLVAMLQATIRDSTITAERMICLDRDWPTIAHEPTSNPHNSATPDNLAYVIYTSGSTGQPKGTLLQHRGLCNLAHVAIDWFAIQPDSRVLQFAAFSFDASVSEIVMALLAGATLVLARRELLADGAALLGLLRREAITTVTLPPSLLAVLPPDDLPQLGTVVSAGESCTWTIAERWAGPNGDQRRFLNGYGPTEATVAASYYQYVGRVAGASTVPLGRPIANMQVYVRDAQRQPVPIGVPGELYIGGVQLARGYLNRPDLTAERFVTIDGARLYRSGDLARYLPDGSIEYLGRIDQQIKLRGFRIELGEIEAALQQHPAIQSAVVVARAAASGDQRLVAYIVEEPRTENQEPGMEGREPRTENQEPGAGDGRNGTREQRVNGAREQESKGDDAGRKSPSQESETDADGAPLSALDSSNGSRFLVLGSSVGSSALRAFLKTRLPDYMIPAAFVPLVALPLTPNGKVDRKALPDPDEQGLRDNAYVAPRTPEEELVSGVWSQVLGIAEIGIHDNFFELGGHSLLATQVVSRLRDALHVEIPLPMLFEAPTVAELARSAGQARQVAQGVVAPPIVPVERTAALALSFAQQRLWFLDQLDPGSALYNIPAAIRLEGTLDRALLEQALNAVISRHEILRTTIHTLDGQPRQVIAPSLALSVPLIDLSAYRNTAREAEVQRLASAEAQQPFDLERGPLIRATLLRLAADEHIALFTMHHIVADGWSIGVLIREIAAIYSAAVAGEEASLPPLAIQYADVAQWQRQWLQGSTLEAQLGYWKQQLADSPPLLELPTDRPRPAVQTFAGASQTFTLPPQLAQEIKRLAQRENATVFMTLLAAFQVLLYRYSGQDDISVGTPIANRNRTETEALIGFFVNTLVLRTRMADNPPFRALLKQVRETTLGAYAHQDVPFEMIVDAVQPERSLNTSSLFQVMFALQNAPLRAQELPGLRISAEDTHSATAKFDLTLEMSESADGLIGALEYNTDLFDAATIARLLGNFETLLCAIVAAPEQPVAHLPALTETEQQQVLIDWNQATPYAADRCLHEQFAEQVARTPAAIAVSFEDAALSYAELNGRANQLAHHLRALGVGPETLVGLCMERSLELVVGILGILKAGGAYLPLDLAYPPERLAFMLRDAQAAVLLTQAHILDNLPDHSAQTIALDRDWPVIAQQPSDNPHSGATPDSLAYVIYTSGSTGQPKGVEVTHRNVARLFTATQHWFGFDARDVWTLFHSYAFDFSVWELWGALLYGGRLVVVPYWISRAPDAFYDLLQREQVTVLNQTPSAFRQLITAAEHARSDDLALRYVIFGGEALDFQSLRTWFARHGDQRPQLVNMYGITETTVHVTYRPISARDLAATPGSVIGERIPDLQVYILDAQRQPVPIGVRGELYVSGAGVARGYLNRPELTAERFVTLSFARPDGSAIERRLYKTGDLARFRSQSSPDTADIEYLGRIDHQVKIRGFRIELGEIEAVLSGHPAVRETVVLVREDVPGDKRIVAYVVPQADVELPLAELRSLLKQKLPDYMVPTALIALAELPLTAHGKLDRRALPTADGTRPDAVTYQPPRTDAERALATIWSEVLGVAEVGIHDNFFELGGDSILSIQVISRANQAGLQLTPRQFFQEPTIAGLVELAASASPIHAEQTPVTGDVPLTPIQRWFFEQHPHEPQHWNTSIMLEVAPDLDPALLEQALGYVLAHHDALRLRFERSATGWQQRSVGLDDPVPFSTIDLGHVAAQEQPAALAAATATIQTSLDLTNGPLLRVAHIQLGAGRRGHLLIVFHHLVVDGVSLRIVLANLLEVYQQLSQGQPAHLPPKTTSFRSWAQRLVAYAQTPALRQELDYWRRIEQHAVPRLPVDHSGGANTYGMAERVVVSLSAHETQTLLRQMPATSSAPIEALLLTALALTVAEWTGQPRLLVELDRHGRQDILEGADLSRTVGWFTSIFPMLFDISAAAAPAAALTIVQEQLEHLPNRGIGYGLLRYLSDDEQIRAALARLPQPEISFNYLGQFDHAAAATDSPLPVHVAAESPGPEQHPHNQRSALLYVVGIVTGGELDLQWSYSPGVHKRSTIERLAHHFINELRGLIRHSHAADASVTAQQHRTTPLVIEGDMRDG